MPFLAAAGQADSSGFPVLMLLLPLLGLAFLVVSGRRRTKAAATAQASLSVGDEVRTTSGLFGRLVGLDEHVASLEIASGTVVRFDRRAVLAVAPQGQAPTGRTDETTQEDVVHEGATVTSEDAR